MKEIVKALLKAQKEMGAAKKGATNPFFKSKYADLNAIRESCMPLLNENGIVVVQPTVHIDGKNFVKTMLIHTSGEIIESLTEILFAKVNDAQAQGSGITYARRYGLQSLVNVGADDDDGSGANVEPVAEKQQITEWLSPENFNKALKSDELGVTTTLDIYNGLNGKGMKKEYKDKLNEALKFFKK